MKEDYIMVNRAAYDALYKEYDQRATCKSEYEQRVESLCGAALKYLDASYINPIILEIGPGSGEALAYFEALGYRTLAVELSPKLAYVSKKRSSQSSIIVGNILDLDFVEGSFQIIYAGAIIHLFPLEDALKLIQACYRWLGSQGILFMSTTIHHSAEEGFSEKKDYGKTVTRFRRKWTEMGFRTVLENAGFQVVNRLYSNEQDRGKEWVAFICIKPGV